MLYWSWNYKRKFKWNLIQLPILIFLIVSFLLTSPTIVNVMISLLAIAVVVVTLIYTFFKWKEEESESDGV
ncbi:hypothetical protein GCM10007216_04520 [Thalassobacillus devorans]|uniref:Uncharacterized protein n=1 Tax=Thalassobacillus devorans TaxID=279813 RepID=A0ABQ1NHA7_9BACI|nr:4-hydroxybenzoate polyprenyltransferase [Thalassobacillus devorans]GGC77116.1 hypothetical protein GCM10007216_04520 [Thalassobacillus devorans]